jgi:glycerol-3-phosphate dehydrogenase (NAD(P)+)
MSKKIVIIGAGEIGLSLGRILRQKDFDIKFWDKDPKTLESLGGAEPSLPEIVPPAEYVFLCVPSWAVREALIYITPYLSKKTLVISVSKGIEANSLRTIDQILAAQLPKNQPWALLSGMMIAEEIREGMFGGGLMSSKNIKIAKEAAMLFADSNLHIEPSLDVHGTALCGVLKNIYSLALGISYGLELGENARGMLIVKSVVEIKKIVSLLGGKQETVWGPAGLGDFIATGFSCFSKNHQAGSELAKGKVTNLESEGMVSLSSMIVLLGVKYKKFPVLSALHEIVQGNIEASSAFQKILYGE